MVRTGEDHRRELNNQLHWHTVESKAVLKQSFKRQQHSSEPTRPKERSVQRVSALLAALQWQQVSNNVPTTIH